MTRIQTETYSVQIERDTKTNQILSEKWVDEEGATHRLGDLPADIEYSPRTGKEIRQEWRVDGYWHRDGDEPAIILKDPETGNKYEIQYFIDGLEHRDSGPSTITFDPETGHITRKEWRKRGVFSGGEEKPSIIEFDKNTGLKTRLIYGLINAINRQSGPAILDLDPESGEVIAEHFYAHDQLIKTNQIKPPSMT